MKRILLLLLILIAVFCAHAEGSAFTEGEPHTSSPAFAQYFKTMTAPLPAGTLAIAQRIYDPAQADELLSAILSDLAAIEDCTGAPLQEHTIYIVERLVNGSIERQGNRVYVRAADVLSGAYRPLLVCAALGTEEYWIGVGLTGCIWGSDADDAILSAQYHNGNAAVLSLAVPYFLDDFATPEEIALAHDTAVSLCRYALEETGCTTLLAGDGEALRQDWLLAMGIDLDYNAAWCASLQQYRFRPSTSYSLIAEDPCGNTVYLAPMQDVATADDLCRFLHDLIAGPEAIFAMIDEQAPEYAALLRGRYGKLRIYCGQNGSWSVPEYREIRLALGAGFMHELTHILVPPVTGANFYSTMWQYEGLCWWAGYQVYPMHAQQSQTYQALHLFADMAEPQTPNHRFSKLAVTLYMNGSTLPASPADADVARYAHAMALVPLRWPDVAPDSAWAATIQDSYPGLRREAGNELTDYQSFSFTAHLIGKHGLATFLQFCTDGVPFEEAFGVSYTAAHEDWIAEFDTLFD